MAPGMLLELEGLFGAVCGFRCELHSRGKHIYSSEIIPTRCNNCGLFFANALVYMFWVTVPPIIRSTCAVYDHR